jgi:hypothetical protein
MGSAAPTDASYGAIEQDAQLGNDVRRVLSLHDRIRSATSCDSSRVLGMVAAAAGAEQYLAYTIPRIVRQLEATGRRADLVIGLNNGFRCERTVAYLKSLEGIQVIELYTGDKSGPTIPAACFDRSAEQTTPYTIPAADRSQHRVFVVYQRQGPHAAGKIRMLDDLGRGLLLPSIEAGWHPPQYTLVFDAETIFIAQTEDRSLDTELSQMRTLLARLSGNIERVVNTLIQAYTSSKQRPPAGVPAPQRQPLDFESNGLAPLIDLLDSRPELHITGAITRFCAYETVQTIGGMDLRLPRFATPCSAMHTIYNYTCGIIPGCMCMPGGGTLGRTECMLSLLATISELYPGTTSEDAILTVLAEPAGFQIAMCHQSLMTNRCPRIDQWTNHQPPRLAWQHQFVRWYAGFDAVERHYGRHNAGAVLGPSSDEFVTAILAVFWKTLRRTGDIPGNLALLNQFAACSNAYEEIRALAATTPDELVGPNGRPAW